LVPLPLLLLPLDPGVRDGLLPEPDMPPDELPLLPLPVADEPLLPLPALPELPPLSQPVTSVPATASAKTTEMIRFMGGSFQEPDLMQGMRHSAGPGNAARMDKSRGGPY
jgi:hypothetical protein